ncbi:flavin reductase [Bosea sp. 124]|uniref:flavin reductase n=1 Tax=Bosea sp. 124 TaxID=2135642 RepID=UPI000D39042C|nr:flavin reductase [Bosea sp. 124]PTM42889.1 flavin reductase (DIM6/NTAB) family NADH-FMN oxidoreductase RutF [Bosea sp. 124]
MLATAPQQPATIDPVALRRAFGTFLTGVTVITTHDAEGRPRGMTANSFTSVSLDPPLLLVCVGRGASSFSAFDTADSFAVNLLQEEQRELSNLFASKSADKFANVPYDRVHTGAPILGDCLTWFDCSVHQRVEAGDHVVLIGQVQAFGTSPSAPLAFCRGRYAAVKDPLPPGWLASSSMVVNYLVEWDSKLLLCRDAGGGWSLPQATRRIVDGRLPLANGESLPLLPEDTFLYSVFDVADGDPGHLVYRARLAGDAGSVPLPDGVRFFSYDELPYEQILTRETRSVLRRYVSESSGRRFGIYIDSHDGGRFAMVEDTQAWAGIPQLWERGGAS